MPPPKATSRMTANPVKPTRYRPGKAVAESRSSSEDASSGEEDNDQDDSKIPASNDKPKQPPSKATTVDAKKVTSNLKNVDLNERRRLAEAEEKARRLEEKAEREKQEREAGFVTESESGSEDSSGENEDTDRKPAGASISKARHPRPRGSESDSEEDSSSGSSEESDSSASSAPRKLLRPVFIRKDQRNPTSTATALESTTAQADTDAARRAAEADALVQERIELDAAARAAGKKAWDDDEPEDEGAVDDTDGLDPELERQQWVARELERLKRARAALEEREAEIAEAERRRGLTTPEREREDKERVEKQKEEKAGRGKMSFMQRYHHKGAFYHDEDTDEAGLLNRDIMGGRFAGHEGGKEALPEYLQVRDVTKIGRKGRTRYKDLKTEDTGRWGDFGRDRRGLGGGGRGDRAEGAYVDDERFRPDRDAGGPGATGANASAVSDRKRPYGAEREDDFKRRRKDDEAVR